MTVQLDAAARAQVAPAAAATTPAAPLVAPVASGAPTATTATTATAPKARKSTASVPRKPSTRPATERVPALDGDAAHCIDVNEYQHDLVTFLTTGRLESPYDAVGVASMLEGGSTLEELAEEAPIYHARRLQLFAEAHARLGAFLAGSLRVAANAAAPAPAPAVSAVPLVSGERMERDSERTGDLLRLLNTGKPSPSLYDDSDYIACQMDQGATLDELVAEREADYRRSREFYSRAALLCRQAAEQFGAPAPGLLPPLPPEGEIKRLPFEERTAMGEPRAEAVIATMRAIVEEMRGAESLVGTFDELGAVMDELPEPGVPHAACAAFAASIYGADVVNIPDDNSDAYWSFRIGRAFFGAPLDTPARALLEAAAVAVHRITRERAAAGAKARRADATT